MPIPDILCMPFPNKSTPPEERALLDEFSTWVVDCFAQAERTIERIKNHFSSHPIETEIIDQIKASPLMVAFMRGQNPNVMFEVGYRMATRLPLILVAERRIDLPAAIEGFEFVQYDNANHEESQRELNIAIEKVTSLAEISHLQNGVKLLDNLAKEKDDCRLFRLICNRTIDKQMKWILGWKESIAFRGSQQISEIGTFLLEELKSEGFVTQYFPGQDSWGPDLDILTDDEYFETTRKRVKEDGIKVTRVYVLDEIDQVDSAKFRKVANSDIRGGIETMYVLFDDLPDNASKDYAVWDDELLCKVEYQKRQYNTNQLHKCEYFREPAEVTRGQEWKASILVKAKPAPFFPSEVKLTNAILESENFHPWENRCDDCRDYHQSWPLLRSLGLVSTPKWHAKFYRSWLQSIRQGWAKNVGQRNVLVTGLADYSMLFWAVQWLNSFKIGSDRSNVCNFHVLDICETPLRSCSWMKSEVIKEGVDFDFSMSPVQKSIFENGLPDGSFDLVISDAFLTRFDDANKSKVIGEWGRLLKPGGFVLTTARHCPQEGSGLITDKLRAEFVERAKSVGKKSNYLCGNLDVVTEAAQRYAKTIVSAPFADIATLHDTLNQEPLSVIDIEFDRSKQYEMAPATYGRIVLKKNED